MNSDANKTLERLPLGQPILSDHHSANRHRSLIERAQNNIRKSIKEDEKSEFYNNRAESAKNSKVIYNDDPKAIEKLKEKLERLENQRASIKAREHQTWELTNIGATIRETKKRIERLENQEKIQFDEIKFEGGKAIHNKEINRIQLMFDGKPDEEIRNQLKHNGFHWSRNEGAWQREFNKRTIYVTNSLIKDVLNNENSKQDEEGEEFE